MHDTQMKLVQVD